MNTPTPPVCGQRKVDTEHLRLLVIFHFIGAGFSVVGMAFLAVHCAIMRTIFVNNPNFPANAKGGVAPAEVFAVLKWVYLIGAVVLVVYGVLNQLCSARQVRGGRVISINE